MASLLHVEDLSVSFLSEGQPVKVVNSFNLNLEPGKVIGIVGESGSGKSVSMLSITRLLEGGKVTCAKMEVQDADHMLDLQAIEPAVLESIRGRVISYIFQEPMTALHPLFTCGQQIEESILWHQDKTATEARRTAIDLLDEMKLPNPERVHASYPHQLSGGQRQRVMIAMALANDPQVIIADEPTTALDSILQKELVENMVSSCKKRNAGLILISHDINVIRSYTDELIVMYKGDTIESGPTQQVINRPQSIYTESLLQCQPTFTKHGQWLPTIHELADYEDGEFTKKAFKPTSFQFQPIGDDAYIEVSGVSKTFVKKGIETRALQDVSFSIFKGETLGLIGESGCGKSTLSKVIIRLLQPDTGQVLFQGAPSQNRKTFARKVQMIFQDPYSSLNPVLKAGDIIAEPLLVHRITSGKDETRNKVENLLTEVGLQPSDYDKFPHEFSGGQRQRISIARALAVEPDLIICDESVSALDVSVQAQILNLFNQLKTSRKLTYLFISHDLNVVSYICDRILVMRNGELLEEGDTQKIVTNPDQDYTRMLLSNR